MLGTEGGQVCSIGGNIGMQTLGKSPGNSSKKGVFFGITRDWWSRKVGH